MTTVIHPNRQPFHGVLAIVDRLTDRAPSGSGGRRVMLTRQAAEDALSTLIGMGLNYADRLDRHEQRRKVGVIERAELRGAELWVGGCIWAKDFPEIVERLKDLAIDQEIDREIAASADDGNGCGLSYEIADVQLADGCSGCRRFLSTTWTLAKVTFTGAAILRRDKAACAGTWIRPGEMAGIGEL